jgi:hypothetical protein
VPPLGKTLAAASVVLVRAAEPEQAVAKRRPAIRTLIPHLGIGVSL